MEPGPRWPLPLPFSFTGHRAGAELQGFLEAGIGKSARMQPRLDRVSAAGPRIRPVLCKRQSPNCGPTVAGCARGCAETASRAVSCFPRNPAGHRHLLPSPPSSFCPSLALRQTSEVRPGDPSHCPPHPRGPASVGVSAQGCSGLLLLRGRPGHWDMLLGRQPGSPVPASSSHCPLPSQQRALPGTGTSCSWRSLLAL